MTAGLCLFCNRPDKKYNPGPGLDFICSLCVILLADADQDDLKRAHAKAIEKGYQGKAEAIKSFLIEDEYNVRKTEKPKRDLARERPMRAVRPSRYQVRA